MKRQLRDWIPELFSGEHPRKLLIRVDAGSVPGLSFGHLSRCLLVAKAAAGRFGTQATFLMADYPEGITHAEAAGQAVEKLQSGSGDLYDPDVLMGYASRGGFDWLIVDLPYNDYATDWFRQLRAQGTKIVFIDDSRFCVPAADVLLNSSVLAPVRTDTARASGTRMLLGPDYFIFDDDLCRLPSVRTEGKCNVTLTFGGSDPTGLTLKVLGVLLQDLWADVVFRVVLGPGFEDVGQAAELLAGQRAFELHHNPGQIMPYLNGADLVICAGGRTMYELNYLDKKFLPIASAAHEAEAIAGFVERGLVPAGLTGWNQSEFIERFEHVLLMLKGKHDLKFTS